MTKATNGHYLKHQIANITITKDWENKTVILEQDGQRIAIPINQVRHLIDVLATSAGEIAGATVGDGTVFV